MTVSPWARWAGASPAQLAPIVEWHAARGNDVLALLPDLFGRSDGEQLEALAAALTAGRACWLHIFSNNGAFFTKRALAARWACDTKSCHRSLCQLPFVPCVFRCHFRA